MSWPPSSAGRSTGRSSPRLWAGRPNAWTPSSRSPARDWSLRRGAPRWRHPRRRPGASPGAGSPPAGPSWPRRRSPPGPGPCRGCRGSGGTPAPSSRSEPSPHSIARHAPSGTEASSRDRCRVGHVSRRCGRGDHRRGGIDQYLLPEGHDRPVVLPTVVRCDTDGSAGGRRRHPLRLSTAPALAARRVDYQYEPLPQCHAGGRIAGLIHGGPRAQRITHTIDPFTGPHPRGATARSYLIDHSGRALEPSVSLLVVRGPVSRRR